ncbi:helix-turn-helix domain protein [Ruminiclostridium papyrosolvens DSM 2782]|uniref:Helix-turn-helix domain protein n=1 Tax=Ruminiclostridium papyrosolvens DSM 2782 TaxID=588581 RepID=F1T8F2_9FIRM|nr:helix-turn-helix transcriptional regulator [Ruminiclostridium papyrosolvens]EGD49750.1 helix-turn-helix domain protein [Ruminiclostridium papyrosolvens DSM 2782]WES33123.1 helix-turn-helix transcriptional regulator [Ruminiclostridium papyrosolvens DSM 2782]
MRFGDRLRELREERDITQKKLGELINVSARVIGYYEANDRFPRDENVLKTLADFFNVSVDYLVGRTEIRFSSDDIVAESKISYNLDVKGLPDEALKKVEDYIDLIKTKYKSNNNSPKKK